MIPRSGLTFVRLVPSKRRRRRQVGLKMQNKSFLGSCLALADVGSTRSHLTMTHYIPIHPILATVDT